MSYIVVSYYTKDTPYEKDAAFLSKSCKRLNIAHDIQPINTFGAWDKNCAYKPTFLLKMLEKHQKDLVWTDADSFFVASPFYFDNPDCELALKIYPDVKNESIHKMVSCTIFLKNCRKIKTLLKNWEKACVKKKKTLSADRFLYDQAVLKDLLLNKKCNIDYKPLPISHCKVFDSKVDEAYDSQNILVHTQGSRSNHYAIADVLSNNLLNTFTLESLWRLRDVFNAKVDSLLKLKTFIDRDSDSFN